MKTIQSKMILIIATCSLILLSGCQIPGKEVSTEACSICPSCEMQTVTTPIRGLNYIRMACPMCKKVQTDQAQVSAALANYTSMDIDSVQTCPMCQSIVSPCPACTGK